MVVNGLSKSSFKLLLFGAKLTHCQSLAVFQGRWGFSWSFMVAEIDLGSIPATLSLIVFEGRYWCLQKFHSKFQVSNDRERPLTTIWKPGFILNLTPENR